MTATASPLNTMTTNLRYALRIWIPVSGKYNPAPRVGKGPLPTRQRHAANTVAAGCFSGDVLAPDLARTLGADLLVLGADVDGVYTAASFYRGLGPKHCVHADLLIDQLPAVAIVVEFIGRDKDQVQGFFCPGHVVEDRELAP